MLMGLGVGARVLDPGPAASEGGTGIGRGRGGSQRGRVGRERSLKVREEPGSWQRLPPVALTWALEQSLLLPVLGERRASLLKPDQARPGSEPTGQRMEEDGEGVTHQMALQGERG